MLIEDKFFCNGDFIKSKSNEFIEVINPSNEEVIAQVVKITDEEVKMAVDAAYDAVDSWKKVPMDEKKEYLYKIVKGIEENIEDLTNTITMELGAPVSFCRGGQVKLAIKEMKALLEEVDNYKFEEEMFGSLILKEPFGVIACITPWNWPLNQIQRKLTPALLAGNTLVVKPSSQTPLTAIKFAKIIKEANLPKGVFNLILGDGKNTGNKLAENSKVRLISFTGSTEVGENLYTLAGKGIKKLILELGGKSPLIHLKGGNKSISVSRAMDAVISNGGQSCSALTRLLVPRDEVDEFERLVMEYKDKVIIGDPTNKETKLGPLVSKEQMDKVLKLIDSGINEGAKLLFGGKRYKDKGYFVELTVFSNVNNDMEIAKKEIFGPVLSIIAYDTVEEAIKIANDTTYGLSSCVVGDEKEAIEVAKKIEAGNVFINDSIKSSKVPFGGYKESGLGREVGIYGLEDYLETKAIILRDN